MFKEDDKTVIGTAVLKGSKREVTLFADGTFIKQIGGGDGTDANGGTAEFKVNEDSDIKDVVQSLGKAFHEFKKAHDKQLEEIKKYGVADATTTAALENTKKALDEMDEFKERIETAVKRGLEANVLLEKETNKLAVEYKCDFKTATEYKDAMLSYLRSGEKGDIAKIEQKAFGLSDDRTGGFLIRPEVRAGILELLFEKTPMFSLATVETINAKSLEVDREITDIGSGSWIGEREETTEGDAIDFGTLDINMNKHYVEVKAYDDMIDDADFDLEAYIQRKAGDKLQRVENAVFLTGNGVKKPQGLLSYPAGSGLDSIEQIDSGANGGITDADKLFTIQDSLEEHYNTNSSWLMRRAVKSSIRTLKDTANGQYLLVPGIKDGDQDSLLGRPVVIAPDMPAAATGSLSILYGDIRQAYTIIQRNGMKIKRDEVTSKSGVIFTIFRRVGGGAVRTDAVKIMKFSA